MNGIFSARPGSGPIRLMIGSEVLLLVPSVIAWHLPTATGQLRLLIAITGLVAAGAFVTAIFGEDLDAHQLWRRRRHVR